MKRLIFTLLYNNGHFMLSRNFRLQKIGDLNWLLENYNLHEVSRGLDELMILDISKNKKNIEKFSFFVNEISKKCFVPVTVGGGINNISIADNYMKNGADKLLVNTILSSDQNFVRELISIYGKQCIVAGIDFLEDNKDLVSTNNFKVFSNNGTKEITKDIYEWIKKIIDLNVGEILLQSIDRDGTGNGLFDKLDYDFLNKIKIPVIFMGGIGNFDQIYNGFNKDYINAIATANILNFIGDSFLKTRNFLIEKNISLPSWDADDFINLKYFFNEN